MSFATEIKQEIASKDLPNHCKRAQLSALIQLTSSLTISQGKLGISVRCESSIAVRRIVQFLKELYQVPTDLQVTRKTNLKKNNVYRVKIDEDGRKILEDLGLYNEKGLQSHPKHEIVMRNCCTSAYLAGVFLAYGACNDPQNPSYHLEVSLSDIEHANFIVKLLARFDIQAKVVRRRNRYVVYLKKADYVSGFLALIGAHDAMLRFEDERIARDVKNSFSRIDNCEIANEVKTLRAAQQQIEYIEKIIRLEKYEKLNEKLRNVIDIRMKYQDSSLQELCEAYQRAYGENISKSGMKHRLNKLETFADSLEE